MENLWRAWAAFAYPARMLNRLAPGVAIASLAAVVLVGCTPEEPVSPAASTTTPATVPSPNSEALMVETRAAWDAYRARLSELGAAPDSASLRSLEEVATSDVAAMLLENFEDAADRRIRTEGERLTTAFTLLDTSEAPRSVTVSVCVDLSEERYIGDEGVDLTPADRPDERASIVAFEYNDGASGYLVAGESEFVEGEGADPCDG